MALKEIILQANPVVRPFLLNISLAFFLLMLIEGTAHTRVKLLMYLVSVHFDQCQKALSQGDPHVSESNYSAGDDCRETVILYLSV